MSANVYISTQTDVYLIDTTNNPGTIYLPSTTTSAGFFLTLKDSKGTFRQNNVTVRTIHPTETFEDGTTQKTLNDSFGSYTFIANSNKWFVTGGSQMNSASISSFSTSKELTYGNVTGTGFFTSSVLFSTNIDLYSDKGSLFFGSSPSNAWGGAKTARVLEAEGAGPRVIVSRMEATGGLKTDVRVGANTYTVHGFFPIRGVSTQTFQVTKAGLVEIIIVGFGGDGGQAGGSALDPGGGGGGGAEVIDYTGYPVFLGEGTYVAQVPFEKGATPPNSFSTLFYGPGIFFHARPGGNGSSPGSGGPSGSGLFFGGGSPGGGGSGGGGGAGAGGNGFPNTGVNGWAGGNGGVGVPILNYYSANQATIMVCGGGGGADGYTLFGGTGGLGGGGDGGNNNFVGDVRSNAYYFGGGGGGGQGGASTPRRGFGSPGAVWIRYTNFSTVYN